MHNETSNNNNNTPPQVVTYDDEINLMDLLIALWNQKNVIMLCVFAFVTAGTLFAFLQPKTFESRTSLLILPPIPTEITGETNSAMFAPDIYKDLAIAQDLLKDVTDSVFADDDDPPSPGDLAKRIQISVNKSSEEKGAPSIQSLTLTATIKGTDKEELPLILSSWSDAFIKRNSQLFVNRVGQSYEYIKETFTSVEGDLMRAEEELSSFKKKNPTSILAIQVETMKSLHGEFLSELTKKTRLLSPLEAKAKAIRAFLANEPERVNLSKSLSKEALWGFLAQRLTSGELKELENLCIEDELLNPHHQSLKSELYKLEAEIVSLNTSIRDLGNHIQNAEKETYDKQTQLMEINLETERLSRKATVLKESYNALAKKYQDSRVAIAEAADPIRVIEKPVSPPSIVGPNKKLIVALSGVLGIFVGLFLALVINMIQNYLIQRPKQ